MQPVYKHTQCNSHASGVLSIGMHPDWSRVDVVRTLVHILEKAGWFETGVKAYSNAGRGQQVNTGLLESVSLGWLLSHPLCIWVGKKTVFWSENCQLMRFKSYR